MVLNVLGTPPGLLLCEKQLGDLSHWEWLLTALLLGPVLLWKLLVRALLLGALLLAGLSLESLLFTNLLLSRLLLLQAELASESCSPLQTGTLSSDSPLWSLTLTGSLPDRPALGMLTLQTGMVTPAGVLLAT